MTARQARRVAVKYGASLIALNIAAAVQVIFVVALLARSETATVGSILTDPAFSAFRWIVPLGITVGALAGIVLILPTLRWFAHEDIPTVEQSKRATRIPLHHTASHLALWLAFGFSMAALTHDAEHDVTVLIVIGTVFGAVTTAGTGYLLTERSLRPVTVLASTGTPARRELSVLARLILTWLVCTAIPVAAITLIVIVHSTGKPVAIPAPIELPILIVSAIALGTGLRGTILVARSVSEPVREVSQGMTEIEKGRTDVAVPVYDSSEIGNLQRGFNSMSRGLTERERLRDLFGRHVGTQVASRALEQSDFPRGDVQYAAVLFIDLVGSTAFAVDHPPERVAEVLNEFLAIVVDTVDDNLGFINKFEGDAALAVFGAPQPIDNPAAAALKAARRLRLALGSLDTRNSAENPAGSAPATSGHSAGSAPATPGHSAGSAPMDFGIGVAAGDVFAGDIGALQRYEYTVIGEPVNCAARLSDLAKLAPGRVLVSSRLVDDAGADEARHWQSTGPVELRGYQTPVEVSAVSDA
ncbi:adenylate/guanylate cyclase domain-containing protein [Rhodococcoides fascians]|uniref:adenylate/guanylate cyclase domain-containing protein n=1 Tax=Rhodococcoides fascians TaxID=1828 RepID=UPI00056B883D|nr:adenylate/guanylate cyclase domain-containing protein [Rhodococcus fascians]